MTKKIFGFKLKSLIYLYNEYKEKGFKDGDKLGFLIAIQSLNGGLDVARINAAIINNGETQRFPRIIFEVEKEEFNKIEDYGRQPILFNIKILKIIYEHYQECGFRDDQDINIAIDIQGWHYYVFPCYMETGVYDNNIARIEIGVSEEEYNRKKKNKIVFSLSKLLDLDTIQKQNKTIH